jgi:hypothetical protein
MANDLTRIYDKILARVNLSLRKKLTYIMHANRDYKDEVVAKGQVINITLDLPSTMNDVTPSGNRPDALPDSTTANSEMRINEWKDTTFHLTDKDYAEIDAKAHFLPAVMHSKIRAVAETVEAHVAGRTVELYNFVGAAGATPFATDQQAIVDAYKVLSDNHNEHFGRTFIMDTASQAAGAMLNVFSDASQTGDNEVKVEGQLGRKYGFNNLASTFVPSHTLGATGTVLTVGTNAINTTGDDSVQTLALDGLTASPVEGDLFTIAGDTTQYVIVSSGAYVDAVTTVNVVINPALSVAATDGLAVTFIGDHVKNVAFTERGLTFAQRKLSSDTATNAVIRELTDPVSKLSVRMELDRGHYADITKMDIMYDAKWVNKESGVVVLG